MLKDKMLHTHKQISINLLFSINLQISINISIMYFCLSQRNKEYYREVYEIHYICPHTFTKFKKWSRII